LLISTLRNYVEAMGGDLCLIASFPDRPPVAVTGLAGIEAEGRASAERATGRRRPQTAGSFHFSRWAHSVFPLSVEARTTASRAYRR
jgi:hypothetical protein